MTECSLDQTMIDLRLIAVCDWESATVENLVSFGDYSGVLGAQDLNRADPDDDRVVIHYTRVLLAITLFVFDVWTWIPSPDAPEPADAGDWILRTYEIKTREEM